VRTSGAYKHRSGHELEIEARRISDRGSSSGGRVATIKSFVEIDEVLVGRASTASKRANGVRE
jgi:hypothetical protein